MTCNSFGFFAIMKGKTMNMLKLSTFFQNGMVLQQDKEIKIWGEGKAEAQVRIHFQGQQAAVITGGDGRWELFLNKLRVGGPYIMQVFHGRRHWN